MTLEQFTSNMQILKEEYPKWQAPVVTLIAVHTNDPYRVLVSTVISLRTKDQVTAVASERLFAKAENASQLAELSESEIAELIYPAGFYTRKAEQLKKIGAILCTDYQNRVPADLNSLLALPGVGRKTANLVLSLAFGQEAICVDIHVHRISNRWGMVQTKHPEETEFALMKKVPAKMWREINDLMVAFGQTICRPVGPKCSLCRVTGCATRKAEFKI